MDDGGFPRGRGGQGSTFPSFVVMWHMTQQQVHVNCPFYEEQVENYIVVHK